MLLPTRLPRLLFIVACLGLGVSGCGGKDTSVPTSAKPDSHQRMVNALEAIQRRAQSRDPFFEIESVKRFEEKLASIPPKGYEADLAETHLDLATHYRRLGENDKAVEHMLAVKELTIDGGLIKEDKASAAMFFELGLTYLRLAETENCVHCRTGESCILPIGPGGVHRKKEGSRQAVESFKETLRRDPGDLTARWLLNVAAMTLGEYPDAVPEEFRVPLESLRSEVEFLHFDDVAASAGLRMVGCAGGAVADDFDGDGLYDVFTSDYDPAGQARFFRNLGNGKFKDQTKEAGLIGIVGGLNCIPADYDNDGRLDVLITRGAWLDDLGRQPSSLLRNVGGGRFKDVTFAVGLADKPQPTLSAAWADYDLDGDLDVYFGHEGPASRLFRNEGGKAFTDVTATAGVANKLMTKGTIWGDYDGDRWPDLYVSNLDGPNRLYHNEGNGTFVDVAERLGVTGPAVGFPTWFWDVNNDGTLDLFAASYDRGVSRTAADFFDLPGVGEPDRLYLGEGDGTFREVSEEFGLAKRDTQPMGSNFGDLDNDGFPDFYLGTGYPGLEALMPNLMFHNRGGKGFDDVTFSGGFGHLQKGHGVAFADFDEDGDQDIFTKMGGAYPSDAYGSLLFENPGFGNRAVRVKLEGVRSNRSAIGARIRADIREGDSLRSVYKWVNSGGSFGANPLEQHVGIGMANEIEALEIFWPTMGETQRFEHVPAGSRIEVREGEKTYRRRDEKPAGVARGT